MEDAVKSGRGGCSAMVGEWMRMLKGGPAQLLSLE